MFTFQDLKKSTDISEFVSNAIYQHKSSKLYNDMVTAVSYDTGENKTIRTFQKFVYSIKGETDVDDTSANWKLATSIFSTLVTQQNEYSLANGVNFADNTTDKQLGSEFDDEIKTIARASILGGKAWGFYTDKEIFCFDATEFAPIYDENTGELAAGIRFYQIDKDKPFLAWLYEPDGYTTFKSENGIDDLKVVRDKVGYKAVVKGNDFDGYVVTNNENYGSLPIVELKCNNYGIAELGYIRDKVDAYDIMFSGLANDIDENAFIYWLISNAGGMDSREVDRFKKILKYTHVANVNSDDDTRVEHFSKDVPVEARETILNRLKNDIYESWSAFNPSTISAGSVTATQIKSAYMSADNKASNFEKHVRRFVQKILAFKNIDVKGYEITFIRQKLIDESELADTTLKKVQTLMLVAEELDKETLLTAISKIIPELVDMNVKAVIEAKTREVIDNLD